MTPPILGVGARSLRLRRPGPPVRPPNDQVADGLLFRPRPVPPGVQPRCRVESARGCQNGQPASSDDVVVQLGAAWQHGDGGRVLTGLWRARHEERGVTLAHRGAGGMALLRSAQAQWPGLAVAEQAPPELGWRVAWHPWALGQSGTTSTALGSVVIAGGLGGIGLRLAAYLRAGGIPVWLIDRRAPDDLPAPSGHSLEALLRAGGVTVTQSALRPEQLPALENLAPHVMSHAVMAAGRFVAADMAGMTSDDIDKAAMEKLGPWRTLVRLGATRHLTRVVVLGSIESRSPHARFGLYAHANEQVRLGARSLARSFPEICCTVVESTLWSEVGMAAAQTTPARLAGFAHVPPTWGVDMLTRLLAERRAPSSVAMGGPAGLDGFAVRALPGVAGTANPSVGGEQSVDRLLRMCTPAGTSLPIRPTVSDSGLVHVRNEGTHLRLWRADR